jgi:RNA polymerase sigma-70 factor (ECF subfamily)
MTTDDEKLLRQLRAGERDAFEHVVLLHYECVWRQHFLVCGSRDTAADLTQETFVEAWRSLPTFGGRAALRTWLHTIAVRVWHRFLAKQPPAPAFLDALETLPDRSAATPHQAAEHVLRAETLSCALLRLPPAQREVLVLCYRQQLSHAEAARALGVPVGTVKSRLHEGLKRLRRLLGPSEELL